LQKGFDVAQSVILVELRAGLRGLRNMETDRHYSLLPCVHNSSGAHQSLTQLVKGKLVPLQARGAQRVPES